MTQNDDVATDDVSALESGIVGLHIDPLKKDEILENNWIIYNSVKNHINRHMQEKVGLVCFTFVFALLHKMIIKNG